MPKGNMRWLQKDPPPLAPRPKTVRQGLFISNKPTDDEYHDVILQEHRNNNGEPVFLIGTERWYSRQESLELAINWGEISLEETSGNEPLSSNWESFVFYIQLMRLNDREEIDTETEKKKREAIMRELWES